MGFGILFIGYLLLVEIPFLGGFDLAFLGFFIMLFGLRELRGYEDGFGRAMLPAAVLVPLCLWLTLGHFFPALLPEALAGWLEPIRYLLVILYHILLLTAMRRLASEVEQPRNAAACGRLLALVLIYLAGLLAINLPIPALQAWLADVPKAVLLFTVCWNLVLLLVSYRIFVCFRDIAPADEP